MAGNQPIEAHVSLRDTHKLPCMYDAIFFIVSKKSVDNFGERDKPVASLIKNGFGAGF